MVLLTKRYVMVYVKMIALQVHSKYRTVCISYHISRPALKSALPRPQLSPCSKTKGLAALSAAYLDRTYPLHSEL